MHGRRLLLVGLVLVAPVAQARAQRPPVAVSGTALRAPRFVVDPMWPDPMPNHWILGSATGVAVDRRDHIYVVHLTDSFNQRTESGLASNPPTGECCAPAPNVLEFDAAGRLVGHWGGRGTDADWPEMNAGIAVDDRDAVWIGGSGGADSRVLKFSRDGRLLGEFGKPNALAPTVASAAGGPARGGSRRTPPLPPNSNSTESFGGPAGFAFDMPANEAYVADGFRNHRVAVIDMSTGAIKRYWGAYGRKPDDGAVAGYDPRAPAARQFGVVRCVVLSADGFLYVCDSQNDRIQVFRKNGTFVKEAHVAPRTLGAGSVWSIALSRDPGQRYLYVADGMNMKIHVLDRGSLAELTSFGDGGRQPGEFYAVDGVATDSKDNLYTVETYEGKRLQKFTYQGMGPVISRDNGVVWPSATAPSGSKR